MMEIFLAWILFSVLVAYYAKTKGRDWVKALLLSLVISPLIGFFVVVLLEDKSDEIKTSNGELKKCPACAEFVKSEAIKCKHCGETLQSSPANSSEAALRNLIDNIKNN